MSWSVTAIGKPAAVAAAIESQFAQSKCAEPEESIRQSARAAIAAALAAQSPSTAVKVSAYGSQSTFYKTGQPDGVTNNLSITIEPQQNFVE